MTKKHIIATTAGLGLLLVVAATVALASGDRDRDHDGEGRGWLHHKVDPERLVSRLDRQLDLDPDQEVEIKDILTERMARLKDMHDERMQRGRELLLSDSIATEDVVELINFRGNVDHLQTELAETIVAVHSVLTPDQRMAAVEMLEQHRGGRWHRGGRNGRWFNWHH